jgi:hypothetical protein
METATNRLIRERSPYLRGAAHQPVQWFPWSPEAFREAERLDRPILLDIGAAWCHWCHVIDRESYENGEIANLINEKFVAIKVDRDERPDIDSRYQLAVGALTGQGGWPLTAFLTPRGEVFYGGTYFPPEDRYGQPGFKRILKRIAELYLTRKEDILGDAKKISALFEAQRTVPASQEGLSPALLEGCLETLKHQFDFAHGGFGNAPKFFHPTALELALDQSFFLRASWLRAVVEKTLDGMGKGGVYDQLGGGFHRYSVDERWIVPHFEKMSYDNASLLSVYAKAYLLFGKPHYKEIAEGIIGWAGEAMTDALEGGFYASQDADINLHDDGDYYTWTRREAEALLTKEEAQAVLPHFNIEEQGEMLHDPSRNVLFIAREPEMLARELELKLQEVIQRIASAKKKLLDARRKRKTPFVDQTLYTHWNALWIRAYFSAYRALHLPELKDFALTTLNRFMGRGFQPEKGMVRFLSEEAVPAEGILEDQAEMLAASLEAFEMTGESAYLDFSRQLAGLVLKRFAAEGGGFFDIATPREEGHLRFQERRIQDSPSCAANATLASALLRLFHLTGESDYRDSAERLLRYFLEEAKGVSYFAAGYFLGLDFFLRGAAKIVVLGKKTDPLFSRLHESALFAFHPHSVVVPLTHESQRALLDEETRRRLEEAEAGSGLASAVVCTENVCKPVTHDPQELARQISGSPSP